jgi:hypothetical protein
LPGWTWDAQAEKSEEGFRRLMEYVERHGDARVPHSCKVDRYPLGQWVITKRSQYAEGRLDSVTRRSLEELPGWTWDPYADKWEESFERLLNFAKSHGHARVPATYVVDDNPLGSWVGTQRSWYKSGRLEADRQDRLQRVSGWSWDTFVDDWEQGFDHLLRYVESRGEALVPRSYTIDGYRLGDWVTLQRHSRGKGSLDADREHRLCEVPGWAWDAAAAKWEIGFGCLVNYVKLHGDARVPKSYAIDDYPLGSWIGTQRSFQAKGKLDPDRRRRLQALPGWTWNPTADKWEDGFRQLLNYVWRHGDARVPVLYADDGYPLGQWVHVQRRNHAKGTLDVDREERLANVTGWTWDARP